MSAAPMLLGGLIAAAGFVTFFVLLARHGAMAKSKQFAAIRELESGRAGRGARLAFHLALAGMFLGSCFMFAGVAMGDADRAAACSSTCKERGYQSGRVRGSTAVDPKNPNRHAFVACACEKGPAPDPLELQADRLLR